MLILFSCSFFFAPSRSVESRRFPQQRLAAAIVRHHTENKIIKRVAVVVMPDVRQLMYHNTFYCFHRVKHQKAGKTKTVFSAAAAESLPGGGDPDSGRFNAHQHRITFHDGRQFHVRPLGKLMKQLGGYFFCLLHCC